MGSYFSAGSAEPKDLKEDLSRFSQRIIVFHFSGHGTPDELLLEGVSGDRYPFSNERLLAYLKDEPRLKLVVLTACNKGKYFHLLLARNLNNQISQIYLFVFEYL